MNRRWIIAIMFMLLSAGSVLAQETPLPLLSIGDKVLVRTPPGNNLRLRAEPNAEAELIINLASGLIVTIIDGPEKLTLEIEGQDNEGKEITTIREEIWWKVQIPGGDTEGWALGQVNEVAFLLPVPDEADQVKGATCATALEPVLAIGDDGMVAADVVVNVYKGLNSQVAQAELAGRQIFTVLAGPYCGVDNNYYWYSAYGNETGYVPETQVEPTRRYVSAKVDTTNSRIDLSCPGARPQQLSIGSEAQANPTLSDPVDVRTRPTMTGIDAFLLYPEEIVTITDGPLCYPVRGATQSWWRVENERGVIGWVPEGDTFDYWLLPYEPIITVIDAPCIVTPLSGVNLRSGAGAEFEVVGSAAADTPLGADQQAQASDGLTWWRLTTGEWVASNLVAESEDCALLPQPGENSPTGAPTASSDLTATPALQVTTPPSTATLNPNASCILTTLQPVNFRAQPDTTAEKIGSALIDTLLEADGQIPGADGFTWWRLVNAQGWVRQDLVAESDGCTSLPVVTANP